MAQVQPNIRAERIHGNLQLDASETASASLNLIEGAGPSSITLGDIWHETDRLNFETSGGTEQIAYLSDIVGGGGVSAVTGTTNRITSTGGATPQIDISASYAGQSSITTLGTIASGIWNGTAIGDSYISSAAAWNAKQSALSGTGFVKISGTTISYDNSTYITGVTGTSNRIAVTGTTIDIAATYVGQSSITTLGTIGTGTWQGTAIADTYISSAATWNAKQAALSGTGFVKISGTTISYDNSTYITASSTNTLTNKSGNISQWTNDTGYVLTDGTVIANDILFWDGTNVITSNPGQFQYDPTIQELKHFGGVRFNYNASGGGSYTVTPANYGISSDVGGDIDLPQCSSANLGQILMIKNTAIGVLGATLNVKAFAGDNIDGVNLYTLAPTGAAPGSLNSIIIQSTGGEWFIFGSYRNQ